MGNLISEKGHNMIVPGEQLQSMVDYLIIKVCKKLKDNNTWANKGEIYEDDAMEKINRHGMYCWVEADDGHEYGSSINVSHNQCSAKFHHVVRYAGIGTITLEEVLAKHREIPPMTEHIEKLL